jgi:L-aspartate oxidase
VAAKRAEIRQLMWQACGIVRRTADLQRAQASLAASYIEVKAVYKHYGVNTALVELMNLVTVAELIVSSALQRRESRGLHYSPDFPSTAAEAVPSVINSSLKARYDLESLRSSLKVSSANGFVSLISPPCTPAPSPRAKKGAAVRDLSVRSYTDTE